MSIQDTINSTVNVITTIVNTIEETIMATAKGVAYLFTNFPQVLRNMGHLFKFGLEMGLELGKFGFRALRYIVTNIPEIIKLFAYTIPKEIFEFFRDNFSEAFKFIFYTVPKFFLYDIPKETIKFLGENLPAVAQWLVEVAPEVFATTVGVVLGVAYAPFKIGYDAIRGKLISPESEAQMIENSRLPKEQASVRTDHDFALDRQPAYVPNQQRGVAVSDASPAATLRTIENDAKSGMRLG